VLGVFNPFPCALDVGVFIFKEGFGGVFMGGGGVVKHWDCVVDHLPPSSAEVKEKVEVYFFSPSVPSWCVLG